ncbi:TPA: hypothetical protein ACJXKJ_000489, partial [Salmonella enterica subsp. enterica serovar Montevideo]
SLSSIVHFASIAGINQYNKLQHYKNNLKNQKIYKNLSISTLSPLFLRLPFLAKNPPQQTQPPPPPITRTPANKTRGNVNT